MTVQLQNLFLDVRPALQGTAYDAAQIMLKDPEAILVDAQPTREAVRELLPVLRARAMNARRAGLRIVGLTVMIQRLENLSPAAEVLGYGVSSPRASGNLYFKASDGKPLGTTIVLGQDH